MLPFAVVIFVATNTCGIICTTWFARPEEDECYYPPSGDSRKLQRLVMESATPTDSWKKFTVRTLCKAASYSKAQEKLDKSLETSNLESEAEVNQPAPKKRRTIPNRRYLSDVESGSQRRPVISSDSESEIDQFSENEQPPPVPPPSLQQPTIRKQIPSSRFIPSTPNRHRNSPSQDLTPSTSFRLPVLADDADLTTVVAAINRQFTVLEELKETQKVMCSMLQGVLRCVKGGDFTGSSLPEGASFPVKTIEEFDSMERKLMDPAFLNGVVQVVGDVGGRTLQECVKRAMNFLMKNELCLKFNFIGRHGKRAFGTSTMFEAVYRSVKKNSMTAGVNKGDVERAVGRWLSGARDRDGNRAKRVPARPTPPTPPIPSHDLE